MWKHLCANCKEGELKFHHKKPILKKKYGKTMKYWDKYYQCKNCGSIVKCIVLPSYDQIQKQIQEKHKVKKEE